MSLTLENSMITQELVRHVFDYSDGHLFWRNPSKYKPEIIGDKAESVDGKGYIRVGLNGRRYAAHRIIFLYHKGYLPTHIDHMNGNKKDNRIDNLRASDNETNSYNAKLSKANTSGVKGVSWDKNTSSWCVQIHYKGKRAVYKFFKDFDLAKECACRERLRLHGEFARFS